MRASKLFGILLCLLALDWLVAAETLRVVTSETTTDWNPVRQQSYPALLTSHWISEHLYVNYCKGKGSSSGKRSMGHEGDVSRKLFVVAECQLNGQVVVNQSVPLRPRCECLEDDTLPLAEQRQRFIGHVAYTVDQMKMIKENSYAPYDFAVSKSARLAMQQYDDSTELAVLSRMDFPLLHKSDPAFATQRIHSGNLNELNAVTAGPYQFLDITGNTIRLAARPTSSLLKESSLKQIEITQVMLEQNLLDYLNGDDSPDIVLSLPKGVEFPGGLFYARYSQLNQGFTFIGFNFGTEQEESRMLMDRLDFRQLFTQSLWSIRVIKERLKIEGSFSGESFSPAGTQGVRWPEEKVKALIGQFFPSDKRPDPIEFKILVSPAVQKIFSPSQLSLILGNLNTWWRPYLKFKYINKITPHKFETAKKSGEWDLLFDRFIYGNNRLRQIAFVSPGHALNVCNIDQYTTDEVKHWSSGTQGFEQFRSRVAETWPVAVIGQFDHRDLFSTSIDRGEVGRYCEEQDALPRPYAGIYEWRKKAPQPPTPSSASQK